MTAQYSIVRYVPDPIADESVNIGVIVVGDGQVRARFLDNWSRVRTFGDEDIEFLRDFAAAVESVVDALGSSQMALGGDLQKRVLDEGTLADMAGSWINSIQLSPPRGSLKSSDALIDELSARYLRMRGLHQPKYRDRSYAARLVISQVSEAVQSVLGAHKAGLVRQHRDIFGKYGSHRLDAVVENGRVLFAAHALSFESMSSSSQDETNRAVNLTEWAIRDLRDQGVDIPIGVLVLPPIGPQPAYDRARRALTALGADVTSEAEFAVWSTSTAQTVLGSDQLEASGIFAL